ncbi:MAG: hypothetical protein QW279_02225 [Candidatus Jordarchaeaceae archaeon]
MAKIKITGVDEPEYAMEILKKNIRSRLVEIKEQIQDLKEIIESLERKYGFGWEEFKKKFENGELPEEADSDYVEWKAAAEILQELVNEGRVLEDLLE